MNEDPLQLVSRYSNKGVVVDTNLLLLYFVGRYQPNRIGTFKRTEQFTIKEYELLCGFLSRFQKIVTTPNILSEVSSLSNQFGEPARSEYFKKFAEGISSLDEHYSTSESLAHEAEFIRIGLTDTSIRSLAKGRFLVLTDDFRLSQILLRVGVDVINFNHIRPYAW